MCDQLNFGLQACPQQPSQHSYRRKWAPARSCGALRSAPLPACWPGRRSSPPCSCTARPSPSPCPCTSSTCLEVTTGWSIPYLHPQGCRQAAPAMTHIEYGCESAVRCQAAGPVPQKRRSRDHQGSAVYRQRTSHCSPMNILADENNLEYSSGGGPGQQMVGVRHHNRDELVPHLAISCHTLMNISG